jgi:hypothetical protein
MSETAVHMFKEKTQQQQTGVNGNAGNVIGTRSE